MHSQISTDKALALAASLAAGSTAYADAVRFDNNGSFAFGQLVLDITKPADEQVGFQLGADHAIEMSVHIDKYRNTYSVVDRPRPGDAGSVEFWTGPGTRLEADTIDAGGDIGVGLTDGRWLSGADLATYYAPSYYYGPGGIASVLDLGVPAYIGVRIDLAGDGGFRYGWLGLERTESPGGYPVGTFNVFAWGYETEAGVGIAAGAGVPGPGSLAALALGAVAFGSRKRRTPA